MKLGGILVVALLVAGCKKDDSEPGIDADGDGFAVEDDCDDDNPDVNTGVTETCNGIDDDCDGDVDENLLTTFFTDDDSDGYGVESGAVEACELPVGFATEAGDCDDASATVSPGNIELCDPIDHDCDGDPLLNATGGMNYFEDVDGDGYGDAAANVFMCGAPAGFVENNEDCDDANPDANPGAAELCATDFDDDCDGAVNELPTADGQDFPVDQDGDSYGHAVIVAAACSTGQAVFLDADAIPDGVTVDNSDDCNDLDFNIFPGAIELCDGIDNDCDAATDDDDGPEAIEWWEDVDGDGSGVSTSTLSACVVPAGFVSALLAEDCDDGNPAISPSAPEVCDGGIDNNCDGAVDDSTSVDATDYYIDADSDTYGDAFAAVLRSCDVPLGYVLNDFDCDDQDAGVGAPPPVYADADMDGYGDPAAEEFSCVPLNGFVDNDLDCNDNDIALNPDTLWYEDADLDDYGLLASTLSQCLQPAGYAAVAGDCDDGSASTNPAAPDVCDGIDNDCDLDIDEDCTVEHCGTISADEVWVTDSIHLVTCDVFVRGAGGPVLTIEGGADVRFDPGVRLVVGDTSAGSIRIDGGVRGVTMRASDLANPLSWGGVRIGPQAVTGAESLLENVTIDHAGTQGYGVRIQGVPVTLDGVTIDGAAGDGVLLVSDASATIRNTTVTNSVDAGIAAASNTEFVEFTNNVIADNGTVPLQISATYVDLLDTTSTFSPNGPGGTGPIVLLAGVVDTDSTLRLLDNDYRVDGDIRVEGGGAPQLTVEDGVTISFSSGTGVVVGQNAQGSMSINGVGPDAVLFQGTSPIEGHWDGVTIDDNANDSTISGLTILHGGGNTKGNLYFVARAAVVEDARSQMTLVDVDSGFSSTSGMHAELVKLDVSDSVFHDNLSHGAQILDVVFAESTIDNAAFDDNTSSGVRISPQLVPLLQTDHFSNNVFPIEITGGTVPESATWEPLDEDFYVTGTVRVEDVDAPILTLEAGTTIYHGSTGQIRVATLDQGSLIVNGSSALPVVFSAITDYQGLPTVRGYFKHLELGVFQRQSELHYLQVYYAGQDGQRGGIYTQGVHPNRIEVDHVTVQFSGGHGFVSLAGPELFIHDSVFSDNDDIGVVLGDTVLEELPGQAPSFIDNTIENNGLHGVQVYATDVGRIATSNTFANNNLVTGEPDFIEVTGGDLIRTTTWFDHGIRYRVTSSVDVGGPANPIWTIEPGVTLEFVADPDVGVSIGRNDLLGGIVAVGTPGSPIIFTSAAVVPARGDWRSLELGEECDAAGQNCILDNVIIEYSGGQPDEGALSVVMREPIFSPTPVVVQNTIVRDSGTNGVNIAFYENIVSPTPSPGVVTPMFCEDLNGNGVCDNALVPSDSLTYPGGGFDHCYNSGTGTFGASNLFCDNNDFNIFARNFINPYTPRTCAMAGLSDGPAACP